MSRAAVAGMTAAVLGLGAGVALWSTDATAGVGIDPSRFSAHVSNRWFPLRPGTTFRYRGVKEGKHWYSQHRNGSVWYFGEATRELDRRGRTISTEGSWQAGRDGAQPGIFMPARPRVGQTFRQEYYKGHAEDHFRVLSLRASVKVPYGSYRRGALLTEEWTPLEPEVRGHKLYVAGVGQVKEVSVRGPRELGELVSVRR